MLYRLFDFVVESAIELPDLEEVARGTPTLVVERSTSAIKAPDDLVWSLVWRRDNRPDPAWSLAWDGQDLWLAIPGFADFLLKDGQCLVCSPHPETSELVLGSQLSHSIIPRVFGELGHLVVHASSVLIEGVGSLVFMGPSGAGKSTLAASFVCDGADLVSDDCVLLRNEGGNLVAFVAGAYARLWDDSLETLVGADHNASLLARARRGGKWRHRLAPDTPISGSPPVAGIFDLSLPDSLVEAGDVSIAEGDGARLLSALTEGTLLLDPYRKGNRSRRFAEASEVADACPAFYTISYPRRFDLLPTVRRAIVERVARDGVSGRIWMAS